MIMRWLRRPALHVPAFDFVAGPPRPPALAWALLACGVLAALASATDLWAARERLAEERQGADRWQAAAARQRPAPPAATRTQRDSRAAAAAATATAAREAAWKVARSLQHPWPEVFAAVDAATPAGVSWTALQHEAARPEMRLEGVATDNAAAFALVDALAVQPAMDAVMLTRLDRDDKARPAGGVRFEIGLRLLLGQVSGEGP
jgi:hypothetical protein